MTAENTKLKVPTLAQLHTSGALAKLGLKPIGSPTAASPFAHFQITEATVEKIRQLVGRTVKVDTDGVHGDSMRPVETPNVYRSCYSESCTLFAHLGVS